jgi:type IV pilus assembly protein PilA
MNFKRQSTKGFSLIELLIVVAIILIIAAIAIPNLMKSKLAANQASAVGSLRTIATAEVTYSSTYNTGYSATLADLGPGTTTSATAADMIDGLLSGVSPASATPTKSGYIFTYTAGTADSSGSIDTFGVTCVPVTIGTTGTDGYGVDQTNQIRYTTSGAAPSITNGVTPDNTDPTIGG